MGIRGKSSENRKKCQQIADRKMDKRKGPFSKKDEPEHMQKKKKKEYLSSLARAKGYTEDEWKINLEIMDCNQIEKAYENSRVKSLQLIQ